MCVFAFMHVIGMDEVEIENPVLKTHVKFDMPLNSFSGIVIDGCL